MDISLNNISSIKNKCTLLYGKKKTDRLIPEIKRLLKKYSVKNMAQPKEKMFLNEKDVILIVYGDSIQSSQKKPLKVLFDFIRQYLEETFNTLHILPFYPYSSDNGFSVIDYKKVNPCLGTWRDIDAIIQEEKLMIDLVANHISAKSPWFKEYLKGNPLYENYFLSFDEKPDATSVVRAREHPLFTKFIKNGKEVYLWTTFSNDQIDLNFCNEKVLLSMIDIILFYCSKKVSMIRLDAIGHIWKKLNTSCINLKKVHDIIQLIRMIVDEIYPNVLLVTETNVPCTKNLCYFGNGFNEAQLIYHFSIPFLVLHTFYTANSLRLMNYLCSLDNLSERTAFLNILATHDGIGVVPVKNILSDNEIINVVNHVVNRGGYISYKMVKNGIKKPYELNITYYSAMADAQNSMETNINKFIASQVIILSLKGIPGIYVHSLFGTENDHIGVKKTGENRAINRKKWSFENLQEILSDKKSKEYKIFNKYKRLINKRKAEIAFHPNGKQRVVFIKKEIISLIRISPDGKGKILVLINVTGIPQKIHHSLDSILHSKKRYTDIIAEKSINITKMTLEPYQAMWIKMI